MAMNLTDASGSGTRIDDFLLARVLAYCLEYADGIQFSSQGLSGPDEPPRKSRAGRK